MRALLCLLPAIALTLPLGIAYADETRSAPSRGVTLVGHPGIAKPAHVDGCIVPSKAKTESCERWVTFAKKPPRAIEELQFSRSGDAFFVWSHADGHAHELDLFTTPKAGETGLATQTSHFVPHVGGDFVWLPGERLLQTAGCGTNCVTTRLYSTKKRLLETGGSGIETSPDGKIVVVSDYAGGVSIIDVMAGTMASTAAKDLPTGALFPGDTLFTTANGGKQSGGAGTVTVIFGHAPLNNVETILKRVCSVTSLKKGKGTYVTCVDHLEAAP